MVTGLIKDQCFVETENFKELDERWSNNIMYKEKMILNSIEKFCMRSMMDNLSNFVEQILIFQTNKTQNQILVKLNIWRKDSKNIWEYCNYGIVTETMINSVIYLGIFYKVCRSQRITTVRNASFLLIVRMTVVSSY